MGTATVRRGLGAIKEATERKGGGGDFKPFCPEIRWSAGEEKHILILTDLDELQEYSIHEWIKTGSHTNGDGEVKPDYGFFLSRKDPSIGEAYDELETRLGAQPRLRFLGVAVELIPVTEPGRGGKSKVVGFEIATDTYTTKNDDEEEIEVEYPLIGVISLSASNFWGWLGNYAEKGDVNSTAMSVTRQGGDKDTRYDFIPLSGNDVNLDGLVELASGISYIRETDDFSDIVTEAENVDSDLEAAQIIGGYLLETRIAELSDGVRYHEIVPTIEELPQRWGKKGKKGSAVKGEKTSRATRSTARASSRTKAPDVDEPTQSDEPAEKASGEGDGFSRLRERARTRAKAANQE